VEIETNRPPVEIETKLPPVEIIPPVEIKFVAFLPPVEIVPPMEIMTKPPPVEIVRFALDGGWFVQL